LLNAFTTSAAARPVRWPRAWTGIAAAVGLLLLAPPVHADYAPSLQRAAAHLLSLQQPSGLLRYDFDFLADKGEDMSEISKANMARQAGTAYALAEYYRDSKDESLRQPLQKLLAAFVSASLPLGKSQIQTAIEAVRLHRLPFAQVKLRNALSGMGLLYLPEGEGMLVSPDKTYEGAWAGITALALLAEMNYAQASGDDRFADARRGWRRGLEMLHLPGAGIRELPGATRESSFANGEVWLAFSAYDSIYLGDAEFAARLADLDDYMIETYSDAPQNGFFHWDAIASNMRYAATKEVKFVDFSARQARWALASSTVEDYENHNSCGLIEGMGSVLATLRAAKSTDDRLDERLKKRIDLEMTKNLSLQIPDGTRVLDLAGDVRLDAPRLADNAGGFLAGWSSIYVRIDIAQHCMSAMSKLRRAGIALGQP